ncbi:PepSY domain-containing protein [Neoroseomonas oryzicola]|uniref:PepSY domain-containing protein n=1 Tax=Neoroseomonas oryzicola TaxID=535904 RepID=A0A9X9WJY0_9PROT|nr:PepSY domain-containing protein [Neoroseomonas oryzicola]MBR0660640.1 PepSY domain-containing protein [Neoroseomonas oryzicola]NKE20001.1 PepSY domain-containing protein [Neoroseomonas oryzicola]
MTRFRPIAALDLALAVAAPFGPALASSDDNRPERSGTQAVTPASVRFEAPAAVAAVLGAGYSAISEFEWERGAWEVKADDAQGRRVELRVDATTGAVAPRDR